MESRVMFLCTGNSARSQMAEGWLRHLAGDRFEVVSAGTEPSGVNPLAVEVMRERGVDISAQVSKAVTKYLGQHFLFLITVCDNARERCPIFPGVTHRLHWPIEDPVAIAGDQTQRLAGFRRIRDEIERRIRAWLKEQGQAQ